MYYLYKKFKITTHVLGFSKGLSYLWYLFLYKVLRNIFVSIAYNMFYQKHKIVIDFIEHLDLSIEELPCTPPIKPNIGNDTIWIFWYQGKEKMPEIVRICIESVKKHSVGYKVFLLDKDNISDFLNLPVMNKLGNGMTYTHFSDYVRLSLLSVYGGVWIDATMFVTENIKEKIDGYDFYTIKNVREKLYCVSEYRWSISFMKCSKGNTFINQACMLFRKYWDLYDSQFEYALLDYILAYLVERKDWQYVLDDVPLNNPRTYKDSLFYMLDKPFDMERYNAIIDATWLHKFSCHKEYLRESEGKETLYGKLLREYN